MHRHENQSFEIHQCTFEVNIIEAKSSLRFPCKLSVTWKGQGKKILAKTVNENVTFQRGLATFNEKIRCQTYLKFNKETESYMSRQTSLNLYLISIRKPEDGEKLVGRVKVDLNSVLNSKEYQNEAAYELTECSSKGSTMTFSIECLKVEKSELKPFEIDLQSLEMISGVQDFSSSTNNDEQFQFKAEKKEEQEVHSPLKNDPSSSSLRGRQLKSILSEKQESELKLKIVQLEFEIKKMTEENEKHIKINSDLREQNAAEVEVFKRQIERLNEKLNEELSFKQRCQEEVVKKIAYFEEKIKKLINQLKQSQTGRLENQIENLDIKSELADLKGEVQLYESSFNQQNMEIQRLLKLIQNNQSASKASEAQSNDVSIPLSEKQKEQFNDEIGRLREKIQGLSEQLDLANHAKFKLDEMNEAYECLYSEKKELESIIEEKNNFIEIEQRQAPSAISERFEKQLQILNNDIARLKQQLNQSESGNKEILDLNFRLQEKIQDYSKEVEVVRQQKEEKEENERKLIKENQNLREENERIIFLMEEKDTGIISLEKRIEVLQVEKETIIVEKSQKQLELRTIEGYCSQKQEQNERLINEINNLKESKDELEHQVKEKQYEMKKIQSQIKSNKAKEEANEILEMKNRIAELKNSRKNLEQELKESHQKIEQSQQQILMRESSILEKNLMIENLQRSIEDCIEKNQEAEERIIKFADKEMKMKENIQVLEEQSRKIYDIVLEKEENQDTQNQIIQEKQNTIYQLNEQISSLRQRMVKNDQEVLSLKKQLFEMRKQMVYKNISDNGEQENQSEKFDEISKLNDQRIRELEDEVHKKDEQIQFITVQFEERIAEGEKEKRKLESQIEIMVEEKNQLRRDKNSLVSQIAKLQIAAEEKDLEIVDLKNTTGAVNQERRINSAEGDEVELYKFRIQSLEELNEEYLEKMQEQETAIFNLQEKIKQIELSLQEKLKEPKSHLEGKKSGFSGNQTESSLSENKKLKQKVQMLENQLQFANKSLKEMKSELDDKEMLRMHDELGKQIKSVEDRRKSGVGDSLRKSFVSENEIIEACKFLKEILKKRSENSESESVMEVLINKNAIMEEGFEKITNERGTIQQFARKLSMEFSKIKAKVLKGRESYELKKQFLSSLKPCESQIKQIINLSENLMELQLEVEVE